MGHVQYIKPKTKLYTLFVIRQVLFIGYDSPSASDHGQQGQIVSTGHTGNNAVITSNHSQQFPNATIDIWSTSHTDRPRSVIVI